MMKSHNKSGFAHLSLLTRDSMTLNELEETMKLHNVEDVSGNRDCLILGTSDGRVTDKRVKVAYGYQLTAFMMISFVKK
jgi:hypothetical protein